MKSAKPSEIALVHSIGAHPGGFGFGVFVGAEEQIK
jgi:hypothetical protein